jgi:hypothetical protein
MIKGRGGMGSHKHGISGRAPRFARQKSEQLREQQLEETRRKRKKRNNNSFNSAGEALKSFKPT